MQRPPSMPRDREQTRALPPAVGTYAVRGCNMRRTPYVQPVAPACGRRRPPNGQRLRWAAVCSGQGAPGSEEQATDGLAGGQRPASGLESGQEGCGTSPAAARAPDPSWLRSFQRRAPPFPAQAHGRARVRHDIATLPRIIRGEGADEGSWLVCATLQCARRCGRPVAVVGLCAQELLQQHHQSHLLWSTRTHLPGVLHALGYFEGAVRVPLTAAAQRRPPSVAGRQQHRG